MALKRNVILSILYVFINTGMTLHLLIECYLVKEPGCCYLETCTTPSFFHFHVIDHSFPLDLFQVATVLK